MSPQPKPTAPLPDPPPSFRYALFAGLCTLVVAMRFFSELRLQLFYADVNRGALHNAVLWSAPLDDVFIHFDFARSAARGFPFHWIEGNGYSSGGTSLLYPLLLAVGYLAGFKGTSLMLWSGVVACLCVLGVLMIGRALFLRAGLPSWSAYLLPPVFLGYGVLSWSLFSGMEVALLMLVWAAALAAWWHFCEDPTSPQEASFRRALPLGLANAALVSTRPEALCWMLIFTVFCLPRLKLLGWRKGFLSLTAIALPPFLILLVQTIANRVFTGEWSAAGALVKLEVNHPYWTLQQAIDSWNLFVEYQIDRMMQHHLALPFAWKDLRVEEPGWILLWIAAVPLLFSATRRYAALLWCSTLSWILLVALNGQVRWQNDRYSVPALALLLICVALGLALLARFALNFDKPRLGRALTLLGTAAALTILALGQHALYRDQVWFFARASRNIYDQHMTAALIMRDLSPRPRRVLLGDAGAIPYLSDLPALDIIGLGGYHDLPFARASRLGVGAIVELIERMPTSERPDLLAIYPGWWGDLPSWFGRESFATPVRGNVICGGAAKVVYAANWEPLRGSELPCSPLQGSNIVDSVDVADLVSERSHQQKLQGSVGFVVMKLLPDPNHPERDLWDAGRTLPKGTTLSVTLGGLQPHRNLEIVLRHTAIPRTRLELSVAGTPLPVVAFTRAAGWQEQLLSVPAALVQGATLELRLRALRGELSLYHLWAFQNSSKNR